VIDLSGLTFLDSVGIRLLVEADARSRSNGSRLQLIPGGDQVHRILQLCGLEESLPFVSENGLAGSASEARRPMRPGS